MSATRSRSGGADPMRAEILGVEGLEQLAIALASTHRVGGRTPRVRPLLDRLEDNRATLTATYREAARAQRNGHPVSFAAEWILDNFHIVQEQLREGAEDLPRRYYGELPKLADGEYGGLPRVYAIAAAFIAHTDGHLELESLARVVRAYQTVTPLTIGELWAIPIAMRLGLLENLARLAARVDRARQEVEAADQLVDELIAVSDEGADAVRTLMATRGAKRVAPSTTMFVAEMLQRLRDQDAALDPAVDWLEKRLAEQQTSVNEVLRRERASQAANQVSVGNAITSMRTITATDWSEFFENVSSVDVVLRGDPVAAYELLDFATRDRYRHAVERIARRAPHDETGVARLANELADVARQSDPTDERRAHVGYYLVGDGVAILESAAGYSPLLSERASRLLAGHPTLVYLGAITAITVGLLGLVLQYAARSGASPLGLLAVALVSCIPVSDLALSVVNYIVTLVVAPTVLPKLDLSDGIPASHKTFVVIPMLFSSVDDVVETVGRLEIHYLANQDAELHFGVLSDCRDSDVEESDSDREIVDAASRSIQALNERYGGDRFYLFHRRRVYNEADAVWMGWERKRGKLEEFNLLLRGDPSTSYATVLGDTSVLPLVRYVITLDADTNLPSGAARALVGTIGHPLNSARLDNRTRLVVEGYGILQPRVSVSLVAFAASRFSRIFSGYRGVDPYTTAVSDVYQDLFREGSFVGKGIYDVDAFSSALTGRVPENTLLSHDLFEGCYARTALVTDVELFDDHPSRYDVYTKRKHRWIRGDWQLAPWLLPTTPSANGRQPNVLPLIARWKIFDNLRRSLVGPSALLLLIAGWTVLPGSPLVWTLITVILLAFPVYAHLLTAAMNTPRQAMLASYFRSTWADLCTNTARFAFGLAFHPHQAWISVDAIVRVAWRSLVSRRKLLEWTTAAQTERVVHEARFAASYRSMRSPLAIAIVTSVLVAGFRPSALPVAAAFLIAWMISPALAVWISTPIRVERQPVSAANVATLRRLARMTWRFFDRFLGDDEHWLPPDNYQEDPVPVTAHRTSPTNIGLALIANLVARDLGYIGLLETVERIELTLASVANLERFRGHLLNWYDTTTLAPLSPRYVSTVDSGNFVGHLLALKHGALESATLPLFTEQSLAGLDDTMALLSEQCERLAAAPHWGGTKAINRLASRVFELRASLHNVPDSIGDWIELLRNLERRALILADTVDAIAAERTPDEVDDLRYWAGSVVEQVGSYLRDVDAFGPWVRMVDSAPDGLERETVHKILDDIDLSSHPTADELGEFSADIVAAIDSLDASGIGVKANPWIAKLYYAAIAGERAVIEFRARCAQIALEVDDTLADMDFRFLYDEGRKLFAIGYSVDTSRRDQSFYDLLASESRLGSFVAVCKGDVPAAHWQRLGRALTTAGGSSALVSWSGSMFEYLMPSIVMRTYEGTLLEQTERAAVREQISYGRRQGVPWGISESAYNARDILRNYQYGPFGVPELGLKRGLTDNLVVAPYATALALLVDAPAASANLRRLALEGGEGRFGLYESIDYTPSRTPEGERAVVVKAFMAHHQGMTLASLGERLAGDRMKARFHADPLVRAHEQLLQERSPTHVTALRSVDDELLGGRLLRAPTPAVSRYFETTQSSTPRVNLLSNGSYSVMVTTAGGGYSRRRSIAITRWREDVTRDHWGQFCYVHDTGSGRTWSTTFQPTLVKPRDYAAVFSLEKVEFRRVDLGIETNTSIVVSTEDDAEVRTVRLVNRTSRAREIELTSYAEIVLATQASDDAHPAFSNLFVQTEFLEGPGAILVTRRRRSPSDPEMWAVHVTYVDGVDVGPVQFETDRARFLGRGRTPADPIAVAEARPLSNTAGAVLDPIVSLRRRVRLGPSGEARVVFTTAFADTREKAEALARKYADASGAARASDLAWTNAHVELRHLGISGDEAQIYLRLASRLLFVNADLRARPDVIARNRRGQSGLWAYGISGDLPIVLVRVSEPEHVPLVRQLLHAQELWRIRGLASDLVVLNEHATSYQQALQDELLATVHSSLGANQLDRPGGIFLRRADQMPDEDRILLLTVARAVLVGGRGSLAMQIEREPRRLELAPSFEARRSPQVVAAPQQPLPPVEFWNGVGGFSADGREYIIELADGRTTPAPWTNVIANAGFGFLVTESGGGYTWAGNSHENRLTTWSNDPVTDPVSEAIYIRDEDTGASWTPTPLPMRTASRYVVRHGQGYSSFEVTANGIATELTLFVPADDPVKISRLRIRNVSGERRRLTILSYAELVLGVTRDKSAPFIVTETDPETGALLVRNSYAGDFANHVAFVDSTPRPRSVTGERKEFIGRNGTLDRPNALLRTGLSGQVGAGYDPCAALQVAVTVDAGDEQEVVFAFGQGADLAQARQLISHYRAPGAVEAALGDARARWDTTLNTLHVETPDRTFDTMVNRRLLHQTLGCRVWARAAFYQSGGAYGFRDQLQDVAALVYAEPTIAREQILRAASRQFEEGDVQHWWHPPAGQGVRTRISDDLLWLPFVAAHYAAVTGDERIFDEMADFLEARTLGPGEDEAYFLPETGTDAASLYEHCVRAIERSLAVGAHGLPLMGSGDWNDGMNRVGREGLGESVWVGWFLSMILGRFAAICVSRGDTDRADRYREHAASLVAALEEHAWDGAWYLRAFFDDGTPLGSARNDECRIDSIAQTWGVISRGASPERQARSMAAVEEFLIHRGDGLVKLFTPPFDHSSHDPGYIRGYVPGVRENGGQYTHAALWVVLAYAMLGDGDRAGELFALLNPVNHTATRAGVHRYKVEPYVVAADVYAVPPHTGRGGWTWYTGSASWMYRIAVESILGFTKEGSRLRINPCVPRWWPGYTITYRHDGSLYRISVENPTGVCGGVDLVELDGMQLEGTWIELVGDGRDHTVRVVLGGQRDAAITPGCHLCTRMLKVGLCGAFVTSARHAAISGNWRRCLRLVQHIAHAETG